MDPYVSISLHLGTSATSDMQHLKFGGMPTMNMKCEETPAKMAASMKETCAISMCSLQNLDLPQSSAKETGSQSLQKLVVCHHCQQVFSSPLHLLEHATSCNVASLEANCKLSCVIPECGNSASLMRFDRHRREPFIRPCINEICVARLKVYEDKQCINKLESLNSCNVCSSAVSPNVNFQKDSVMNANINVSVCEKFGKNGENFQNTTNDVDKCISEYDSKFKQWTRFKNHPYGRSDKLHICNSSGKDSIEARLLEKHKQTMSSIKPYVCDVCNAAFKQSSHLKQHKRIHTNETPYACDMCSAAFKQSVHLKQHRRIHTNEKPYVCDVCNGAFRQSEHLKQHKRIHTKETPYACDICSAAFKQSIHLKQHRRIHTNEKPYACDMCGAAFRQSEHLKLHKRTHTNEKPYACDLCSAAFKQSTHLKQHKRVHAAKAIERSFCSLDQR